MRSKRGLLAALALAAVAVGAAVGFFALRGTGGSSAVGRVPVRSDAVTVHGRWTLTVLNHPGGTLVAQRRFENSLIFGGGVLARFLSRQNAVGLWSVQVIGANSTSPCRNLDGTAINQCVLVEKSNPNDYSCCPYIFKPLEASAPTGFFDVGPLTLQGSFTAQGDGPITGVQSNVVQCPPASTGCAGGAGAQDTAFSGTTIAQVNVTGGQQVLVKLNISFT